MFIVIIVTNMFSCRPKAISYGKSYVTDKHLKACLKCHFKQSREEKRWSLYTNNIARKRKDGVFTLIICQEEERWILYTYNIARKRKDGVFSLLLQPGRRKMEYLHLQYSLEEEKWIIYIYTTAGQRKDGVSKLTIYPGRGKKDYLDL